ncbi:metal ABC transporter ATP-binding protein [Myxococcota bacterium]|nr:metal ABC transporter ATP-binding protein [Myxococcota bacterium]
MATSSSFAGVPAVLGPPRPLRASAVRAADKPLIACRGLEIGHDGRALLPPLDLEIRPGEFWAVLGRNGSGKTTWLRTMLELIPVVRGSIDRGHAGLRMAYVPQRSAYDDLYPVRARDIVRMGTERRWSFLASTFREPPEVEAALAELGVSELADRPFRALSEGQKQRVLLARLVASRSELAILDEPTAAMDLVAERESLRLLDGLRKQHQMAVVVVSHGLGTIREYAERALFLDRDTQSIVAGPIDEVLADPRFQARYGLSTGRAP